MGDGKWNGYEWWFHGQHTDASLNSLSISLSLSLRSVIASIVAAAVAAVALFLPCVLLCLFVALGLYTFLFTHHRASALCVEISPEWFLYIHSAVKLQIRIEDRRKTTYIFVGWPIADVANDRHPSERGAHCTILQQQWTYVCIYILYICIQMSDALLSSSFSLHDCTIIITALFHLLVFFRDDFALRFWHWKQSDKFVKTLTLTQAAQPTQLPAGIY